MDNFHFATRQHGPRDADVALPRRRLAIAIAAAFATQLAFAAPPAPNTLPTGGQVAAGQASIQQSGANMAINQTTNSAILNWQSFSIGANAAVNFVQPAASSVTLNRVLGSDPSAIYGRLSANGQVFLVNPSGVLFGPGARVDVGGLVASTLNIRDSDFLSGNFRFTRDGGSGSVVNQGDLSGKYVALLAPEVRNEGVISARMGTVALAAGDGVTLGITGQSLVDVRVDRASINTLVENRRLVVAEEGTVILSAQSANTLLGRAVNSGVIEANGISSQGGTVRLLASSEVEHSGSISADGGRNGSGGSVTLIAALDNPASRTLVSGSLSARGGADSGDGGFIETSASRLSISDSARIDAGAANGNSGMWLLDPVDLTIAPNGDISGTTLSAALNLASVTLQTTNVSALCGGAACTGTASAGTDGDILVNQEVSWTGATTLTLSAFRNVNINSPITATNAAGKLALNYNADYFVYAPVTLQAGLNFSTNGTDFTVVTDSASLAAMPLNGKYAIGADFGLVADWTPIGDGGGGFTGTLEGLRHKVTGLKTTNESATFVGLLGAIDAGGSVLNLGVETDAAGIKGAQFVGVVAGKNAGTIKATYSKGLITGSTNGGDTVLAIGGLVGQNEGAISESYSAVKVDATGGIQTTGNGTDGGIGGLVGVMGLGATGITASYATGDVDGVTDVGGLVGYHQVGSLQTVYSSGKVNNGTVLGTTGGLVGTSNLQDQIVDGHWNSDTSMQSDGVGTNSPPPILPGPPLTGYTSADMKLQANFTGTYDFNTTGNWVMYEGVSTPLLRTFLTPLFVYADNKSAVYNKTAAAGVTFSSTTSILAPVGANLTGAVTFSGTAAAGVNVGAYGITPDVDQPTSFGGGTSGLAPSDKSDQHGYLLMPVNGALAIAAKPLTADTTGVTNTKVYDGSTTAGAAALLAAEAAGAGTTADGKPYTGDTVGITGTGTFDSQNVASATKITFGGLALNGADAGNYSLTAAADINGATITAKPVNQTAPVRTKEFDGIATIAPTAGNLAALSAELGVAGDTVTGITLTYDTAAVGTGKTLTPSASVISSGVGNYAITFVPNATSAITAASSEPPATTTTTTSNDDPAARVVRETEKKGEDEQERREFREQSQAFGSDTTRLASFVSSHPEIPGTTRLVGYPVRVSAQSGKDWQLLVGDEPPPVRVGSSTFSVMLPDSTFSHTRRDAVVTLTATQSDGKPLPEWLKFNPKTGTFSGNAPAGFKDKVAVKVNASDNQGQQASVDMTLNFGS